MRLYAKLFVMILIAAAFQRYAPPSAWGGEAWFAVRCHVATLLGDRELSMQLVDEYYHAHRSVSLEEIEEVEFENYQSLPAKADADELAHVGDSHI